MKAVLLFGVLSLLCVAGCRKTPVPEPAKPTAQAEHEQGHAMAALPGSVAEWAKGAQLFGDLGDFQRKISSGWTEAQQYFDQGMRYLWAFNHDESTRSFARAAELDPNCAICFWGVALTVGPNYNLPMMAEPRAKVAFEAVGLAKQNESHASPVEKALIEALAQRYPNAQPLDPVTMMPVLTAYSESMRKVAKDYPKDADVQTLFAESLMNLNAWKLWTPEGKPGPHTLEVQKTLEHVLAGNPQHPGANHYYIHTMEASQHPEKALESAERAKSLMPAAGHLVHMPAHIMQRVGRYDEAVEANRKGAEADEIYLKQTRPLDYYAMYAGHNYQFLIYSAAMEGRKAETLQAARDSRRVSSDEMLLMMPGADWFLAHEYIALVRFGLWDDMLARPAPNPKLLSLTGAYQIGRGVALAAKGRASEAKQASSDLQAYIAKLPADAAAGFNTAKDVLEIGSLVVQSRIATAEKRVQDSIALLREAASREDKLAYNEPKDWLFPVRHLLGAQLLAAGQAKDAEAIYREDLKQNPANGWALYGLAESLRAQKKAGAEKVDQEFRTAWKRADIELTASAF